MRILVAEDERITRASLVRQLERWGHDVTAAEDGRRAWELFESEAFDLVLTDWEMPELSGVELIGRIRGDARPGFVYVIMLTSRGDKADVVQGIEAGADDFVAKPFDQEELRVRLLAGQRIVGLERALSAQNAQLRAAGERMRLDLQAAARVQRAMLPQDVIVTPRVRTAWTYVPTDELAGDALGLHLIDDRYLVFYVVDVSGHGVPAALLAVTAMHELAPQPDGSSLLCEPSAAAAAGATGATGAVRPPSRVAFDMNRRFCSGEYDDRFLTMILCVLDTQLGRLHFTCAGHPRPLVLRAGRVVDVSDAGGFPLAVFDGADYEDASLDLEPGDRVHLFSDGIIEQFDPSGRQAFGDERFRDLLASLHDQPIDVAAARTVEALAGWAGGASFHDDVSLVVAEWVGPRG
jgi:sigma-B regulation protein RsbU (phosphoserine phosphatase)